MYSGPPDVSWLRAILERYLGQPRGILPFTGKVATKGEIGYRFSQEKTQHMVLSKTFDAVAWKNTRIVRDVDEIRKVKQQPDKDMHAVGGATLVSSLMNLGLIDEFRLVVQPIVLGKGKALFKDVKERHALKLLRPGAVEVGHGPSDLQRVTRLRYAAQPIAFRPLANLKVRPWKAHTA